MALFIILEASLHFRNSGKHFWGCALFGAVDYNIVKTAIFVRFRRFFIAGTKIAVSARKLPFSGHKLPFWGKNVVFKAIFSIDLFSAIFHRSDKNCRLGTKFAVFRTYTAV